MDIRGIVLTHILNTFLIYIRDGAFELEQTCYTLMEGMGYLKVGEGGGVDKELLKLGWEGWLTRGGHF